MKTLELFCGTKSFSKVAAERGHNTHTIDHKHIFEPDECISVTSITELPKDIDVLWASPPYTCFSIASVSTHWHYPGRPKTWAAKSAVNLIEHTMSLIEAARPKFWFVENPRGMMRKLPRMDDHRRITTTYCQYGDTRMKPTDIWTNTDIELKPCCKRGAPRHEAAPRGSKTGTQGRDGAVERGRIPPLLMHAILEYCEGMKEAKS